EQIDRGAFDGVDFSDVRAFYDHQTGNLLGRTKSDTLSLTIDDTGLKFRLLLPNTQLGRDVYELVQRGDLSQCSFGFYVEDERWAEIDGVYHRNVTKISELVEISLVSTPAYD
ncbi:HK97 family phage prohead protease, partial [Bacillus thuringiensis]|nr:HK97 family phage prohead protease [Bacillus thuringiensis]